jgi:hypothetical protein
MRVIDLDLDFFINNIAHNVSDYGKRLDEEFYQPWTEENVRIFLEQNCGLTTSMRIPGRIVRHQDEAFLFWRELIEKGLLKVPFDVVHIDAHADLGLGDASWVYIMGEILHKSIKERMYPKRESHKLCPGSYLAFAVACRWLKSLTFVLHPKWQNDLAWLHFKNYDDNSKYIQLKKYDPKDIDVMEIRNRIPQEVEPEVPFYIINMDEFKDDRPYDYFVLSNSPGYTPASADKLLPIFRDYIDII